MLVVEDARVSYGPQTVLDGLSLTVPPGSTAIMGPSGSGKSTLLRVIAGSQMPTSGSVSIDGEPVVRASWKSPGDPRVSVIFQDYRLVPFLTVAENIALAAEAKCLPVDDRAIEESLVRVGLATDMATRLPGSLSGGEQQRVAIARALAAGAPIVLADEPTGALDAKNSQRVSDILHALGEQGLTVVVATHDPAVASRLDRIISLADGRVREGDNR